jgi:hypothetical protein
MALRIMSALRETRGVVVVRRLHCGHEGSLSRTALVRFGLDPNAPIAAYVRRLRCSKCGSSSVMAKRTSQPNTEQIIGSDAPRTESVVPQAPKNKVGAISKSSLSIDPSFKIPNRSYEAAPDKPPSSEPSISTAPTAFE